MSSYLTPTASLPEVNLVLAEFNIPECHIHPVEFNDKADKTKKMATYTNRMKAASYDQQTIQMLVKESLEGDTISEGVKGMRQKGAVVLLSGDWEIRPLHGPNVCTLGNGLQVAEPQRCAIQPYSATPNTRSHTVLGRKPPRSFSTQIHQDGTN
ncbi:hypothetical protein VC83_00112 [Pseudogymnoascus destructans]|uniref:Uncharacterized protein n=1 Tax=Pseudogymnoascus destructans TaxID=655981 RepID=A0A177ALR8_9PEZI|nr:uncharacterized protein VC83_00112 [Pseudogymnoascus destructans]OAF63009.1 hypothetical protein VC83_00112 [Pseudogymnoascus destructans]